MTTAIKLARQIEAKNRATRRFTGADREGINNKSPPPTRITTREIEEKRVKGLCFKCDDKWSKNHRCSEKRLFIIEETYDEEEEELEEEITLEEHAIEEEEELATVSMHAMAGIAAPQTLKIQGYIKKHKVLVLIDSGSTHNFIDKKLAARLNCFAYPVKNFSVMIANGGSITCGGKCHNIKLSIGDYQLSSAMYAIPMGGVDVVLGVQWLKLLGTFSMNLDELFIRFKVEGR